MEGDGINGGDAAPALAGGAEFQFMPGLGRNLPAKLYRVGLATSATAVGGLVERLVAVATTSVHSRQEAAENDVPVPAPAPLSQLALFFLLATLFGGLGAIYAGRRAELELEHAAAAAPRWRKAGVAVYLSCLMLLVAAVSFVGSDYCELALNFIDHD